MTQDTKSTGYNGWSNYETWACSLWISNDEWLNAYYLELAQKNPVKDMAKVIQEEIEENNPLSKDNFLYADLLNTSIAEIDFYEIAESFKEDTKKETG